MQFTATLVYHADSEAPWTPEALSNVEGSIVVFRTDGAFSIYTSDLALLGSHELHISASLTDFPAVVTASETIISINFARCQVQVLDWVISDTTVPSLQTVT